MFRSLVRLLVVSSLLLAAGTLATVAVRAGGGCHGSATAIASEAVGTTVVKIDGCLFLPTVSRVAVGSAVTFLNTSQVPHDVTGTPGRADSWGSPVLEPGGAFRKTFAAPGVYAYSCSLHPGMAGAIVASAGASAANVERVEAAVPETTLPAPAGSGVEGVALAAGGAGLVLGAAAAWAIRRRGATAG